MQPTDVQFFQIKYTLSVCKLTTYYYALNTLLMHFILCFFIHSTKYIKLWRMNISMFINNIYDVTNKNIQKKLLNKSY